MNRINRLEIRLISLAVASLFGVSLSATAQDDSGTPSGIPWGPVKVYPEVDLTFKSNDNVYSQPGTAARPRNTSNITVLAPKVKLEAKTGPHTFDATYKVEHGRHSYASTDNYTDHTLGANAIWKFTGRSGLKLSAEYLKGHEDRGSVPAVGHPLPDEFHQTSFNALAGYGAEGAQGRVEVEAGLINKRYDNFENDAFGNPDNIKRDRDDTKLGATFFWRVMPKTQLLFQVVETKYDYAQGSFVGVGGAANWTTLDSTERKYLVGVTWEAAAKTTGIFKVGTIKKDFSDASLTDFSKAGWEGQIKWSPLTYSNFDFFVSKLPSESTIGNASVDTRYGATWNHLWSSRLSSAVSYSSTDADYQYTTGTVGTPQSDTTNTLGLKLNYKWTRNVKVGAGYDRTDKTSNNATSEYKRNIYSIFLNAAI